MAVKKKVPAQAEVEKEVKAVKAVKSAKVVKGTSDKEYSKANSAVRTAESKLSAIDNLVKRISKRLGATQPQSKMILRAVVASIQETVIVKGSLSLEGFALLSNSARPASQGTIQFGDKKGELWTKPEHNAIKITNINGFWNKIANDEEELVSIDSLEEIWTEDEAVAEEVEEVEETEEETEEEEVAPVKKAPVKKAKK